MDRKQYLDSLDVTVSLKLTNKCPLECTDLTQLDKEEFNTYPRMTHIHGRVYTLSFNRPSKKMVSTYYVTSYDQESNYPFYKILVDTGDGPEVMNYKLFDLYKLCMLYCKVERALFDLVAPSRYDGSYSKPAREHYSFESIPVKEFKQALLARMYGRNFQDSYKDGMVTWKENKKIFSERTDKYNGVRYYALNLHSFFYRGTIEFRHHHGTTNPDKMAHWGLICANIIEYANKKSVKDIKNLPELPHEALLSILPSHLVKWANNRVKELRGDWTPKQKEIQLRESDGLPF